MDRWTQIRQAGRQAACVSGIGSSERASVELCKIPIVWLYLWILLPIGRCLARASWCLRKVVHCGGENTENWMITYRWLFWGYLISEVGAETLNEFFKGQFGTTRPSILWGTLNNWRPFIHDRWVYMDAKNPKPSTHLRGFRIRGDMESSHERTYFSFIQTKSLKIACNPKIVIVRWFDTRVDFQDPALV